MSGERQWLRYFRLVVAKDGTNTAALDLSGYRVAFRVTQAAVGRPCTAEISVYNVSDDTANQINAPTNERIVTNGNNAEHISVIIEAGYQEHHSVIFNGDLWWKSMSRLSETDTCLRLIAATGKRAHKYSIVDSSLPAGSSQSDVFRTIAQSMKDYGVESYADTSGLMSTKLPRGKVMYGMARDAMQSFADTNNLDWGYTNKGLTAFQKSPRRGQGNKIVILSPSTGLLDRPNATQSGIEARTLLNPDLEFGNYVQIDQSLIQTPDYSTEYKAVQENYAARGKVIAGDGFYQIRSRQHVGDTRGEDWYTDIIAIGVNEGAGFVEPGVWNFLANIQ